MAEEKVKNPATGQAPGQKPGDPSENKGGTQTGGSWGNLFSPGAVAIFLVAGVFDFLGIACLALIPLFNIGMVLSKIVYATAFLIIGGWAFLRSGSTKIKQNQKKTAEMAEKKLGGFLKRNGGKLIGKFVPIIGDLIPYWTLTVYSELKNS